MIGEQVANYKLISRLGEGGMGAVYVGSHIQLGRKAAIKVLHPNLVSNPQIRERFKNEAATLANLRHANIVGLYDYLETTKGLFLIMEYVQGKPLDEFIQQVSGPLSEKNLIHIFSQILDGFEYAHKQGIVHRDIKPSNLLITQEGEVKILDFGIAKILDGTRKNLTQDGTRMGTVLYMSPEQVRGIAVDIRSDIYSLGVTLFQAATGKCPYDENNATEYAIYQQIVNVELPRANTFYPNVSTHIQNIIDKATAKNPEDRFQTCAEFKAALTGQINTSLAYTPTPTQMQVGGRGIPKPEILAKDIPTPNKAKTPATGSAIPSILDNNSYTEKENTYKRTNYRLIWRRINYWFSVLLLLSLIVATGYVVLYNPFELEALRKVAIFAPEKPVNQEPAIKEKLKAFYRAIESRDFEQLKQFYADTLERYYDFNKVRLVPDVKSSVDIYWKLVIAEKHEIDWSTLTYKNDENNNHIITYRLKYEYQGVNSKEWKKLIIQNELKFNKQLLIFSIIKVK